MSNIKGYKTIAFNVAIGAGWIVMVLTGENTVEDVDQVKDALDMIFDAVPVILVVGNSWLRAITSTPIFKST